MKAQLALEQIALTPFQPITSRYNIDLRRGTLSAVGGVEYAPTVRIVRLRQAVIDRLEVDYIHTAETAVVEQRRAQQVKQTARAVSNAPDLLLRADQIRLTHSSLGFVNRAVRPDYRLFLDGAEVHVRNFSNQLTEGTMVDKVTGKFMGSGQTVVGANFRPETNGPDFGLAASIENTQMPALNPLLRAYGRLDAVGGFFSIYPEMRVQNRAVRGYVKPLIRELENIPRREVAAKADIAGPVENPQASTWQVLATLIQNAFFKSEFRERLVDHQAASRVCDLVLVRLQAQGVIHARGRQRPDSTPVLGAIRAINRLALVGEVRRVALNALAIAAPEWLRGHAQPEWFARYGRRVAHSRLPKSSTKSSGSGTTCT